jgi:hypothetical protein
VSLGVECAGGFGSPPLPLLVLECRGVIDARKRLFVRNGDAQKRTEWLPALLDVEDQQPVGGHRLLHRLIVLGKNGLAMRAIGESTLEGAGESDVPGHRR